MSALRARAEEYLAMRRALGFKLTTFGTRLMSFVGFCEERGEDRLTADLALEWALQTSRGSTDEVYQARRLDVVRIFARHLQALDPATEIPPGDVLSRRYRRIPPYLYSPEEITALMSAAGSLAPAVRAATWRTLIGLLAVTGMRQGEACRLGRDHADLQSGTLVITDSKFGKSRQVFLHPTATAALHAYERARDQVFPEPKAATFLVNSRGSPLNEHNVQHTFATLIAAPASRHHPAGVPPGCMTSGIMRTAGLCALPWRFRCWGRRSPRCSPHNPPGLGQRPSESSQPSRDESEVQSGKASGVSGS